MKKPYSNESLICGHAGVRKYYAKDRCRPCYDKWYLSGAINYLRNTR